MICLHPVACGFLLFFFFFLEKEVCAFDSYISLSSSFSVLFGGRERGKKNSYFKFYENELEEKEKM